MILLLLNFSLRCELLLAQRRRIGKHLLQVSPHRFSRRLRIAALDCRQYSLVMVLSSFRPAVHIENAAALLA
jgi:hypothetical protein